jgi:hypothetical protein
MHSSIRIAIDHWTKRLISEEGRKRRYPIVSTLTIGGRIKNSGWGCLSDFIIFEVFDGLMGFYHIGSEFGDGCLNGMAVSL